MRVIIIITKQDDMLVQSASANSLCQHARAGLWRRSPVVATVKLAVLRAPRLAVRSNSGDSEAVPAAMTIEAAYSILGVDSNSSGFEQILAAKNKMLAVNKGNKEKCSEVSRRQRTSVCGCGMRRLWQQLLELSAAVVLERLRDSCAGRNRI